MHPTHRITDWKGLRQALGFSQAQLAELLCVSRHTIMRYEKPGGLPPKIKLEKLLRFFLRHPDFQRRLREARYPHPFPEDVIS